MRDWRGGKYIKVIGSIVKFIRFRCVWSGVWVNGQYDDGIIKMIVKFTVANVRIRGFFILCLALDTSLEKYKKMIINPLIMISENIIGAM